MISVITSSGKADRLQDFKQNVDETIGVSYEFIAIDNSGKTGICAAYNLGAEKAKYDILCFVHDDVKFITNNWGQITISYFQSVQKNIGVLGVAGSVCKSKMPSSWWQPAVNDVEPKRMNIIQHFRYSETASTHHYLNPANEKLSLVATLDGVFLAVKKEVWQQNKFDETLLKGFHGYDIDFTLNVGRTKNNYVVYDILMEHRSEGKTNLDWFKDILSVHKKWRHILPVVKWNAITAATLKQIDRHWFNYLLSAEATTKKEKKQKLALCLKLLPFLGAGSVTFTDMKRFKILVQQLNQP